MEDVFKEVTLVIDTDKTPRVLDNDAWYYEITFIDFTTKQPSTKRVMFRNVNLVIMKKDGGLTLDHVVETTGIDANQYLSILVRDDEGEFLDLKLCPNGPKQYEEKEDYIKWE